METKWNWRDYLSPDEADLFAKVYEAKARWLELNQARASIKNRAVQRRCMTRDGASRRNGTQHFVRTNTPQFIARTKTVTRRKGWRKAVAGQELCGVKKGMGLRPGEKVERLGMIRLVSVTSEQLRRLTRLEYEFVEALPRIGT